MKKATFLDRFFIVSQSSYHSGSLYPSLTRPAVVAHWFSTSDNLIISNSSKFNKPLFDFIGDIDCFNPCFFSIIVVYSY